MLKRAIKAARRRAQSLFPEPLINRRKKRISSTIHPLQIPLQPDHETGWKAYPQFKGATLNISSLSCHVSVLTQGNCPHPPHTHAEEEILMLLTGEADLLLPDEASLGESRRMHIKAGDFVYYPAFFPHTLECVSEMAANYLMLKWSSGRQVRNHGLAFDRFDTTMPEARSTRDNGFHSRRVFQGATGHLRKLHCHATLLEPGGGYDVHVDRHDVVVVMLAGECESLGQRFVPNDIVVYAAGEPHGMRNPTDESAHYVVFEFHGDYTSSIRERIKNRFIQH